MQYSEAFEAFWQAYRCQRRVKKLAAFEAWRKVGGDDIRGDIMEGLARFKLTAQWLEGFAPEPERFIRHRRWEDEPVEQDEAPASDDWNPTGPPKGVDRGHQ